jgi:hypothetical protein
VIHPDSAYEHTIYHEDWWLRAAAGRDLRTIEVDLDEQGSGSFHYTRHKWLGLRVLAMPPYTRTLGPVLRIPPGPAGNREEILRLVQAIVGKLPRYDIFRQELPPHSDEIAQAFSLCGFTVQPNYTFRVPPDVDLDVIWKNLTARRRKLVTSRQNDLQIQLHSDVARFERLATKEYSEQVTSYNFDTIRRLYDAAAARNQAVLLTAVDDRGNDVATAIIVSDAKAAYYWLATRDHALAGRGAKGFMTWHALKLAHERGLIFDFDSYNSFAGARFILSFGVTPVLRPVITNASLFGRLAIACSAAIEPDTKQSLRNLFGYLGGFQRRSGF